MPRRFRASSPPSRQVSEPPDPTVLRARAPAEATITSSVRYELDWSVLMARAQSGDGEAYRQLLRAIVPFVHSLAVRSHSDPRDVEDIIQEVLLTVHKMRRGYDPARPFGPWLVAIAKRRIVDRIRRRSRLADREVACDDYETFSAPAANLGEDVGIVKILGDALERLPPAQRRAVRLLKLQELSLKEAAAVTGSSIASLKVSMHRAMKTLRKIVMATGRP